MPRATRALTRLVCMLALACWCVSATAHPQDGPHADLRYRIEPDGVTLSVGLNLVFMDQFIPPAREAEGALSPGEAAVLESALRDLLREHNPVRINDIPVDPIVRSIELRTEADARLAALYPRSGMRALIRGSAVVDYPVPSQQLAQDGQLPERVELGWDLIPVDELAKVLEPGSPDVRMFIDARLRAAGTTSLIRFSESEPIVEWIAAEHGRGPQFVDLPMPPASETTLRTPSASARPSVWPVWIAAGIAAVCAVALVVPKVRTSAGLAIGAAGLLAAGVAIGLRPVQGDREPGSTVQAPDDLSSGQMIKIAQALHRNMYTAFDYTDESEVYDALARSLAGQAHERLYNDVFASLVQADQGGELGIITGLELVSTDVSRDDAGDHLVFEATHTWRVEGTVYHMGHSHIVEHEYEGVFEITGLDEGWRITDYQIISQQRLGGTPVGEPALPGEL